MILEHEWDQRSVQFPLDEKSIVLDIGAYKGRWSKEIANRYGSRIYAFEPQQWAFEIARKELAEGPNIHLYNFGLGVESGNFEMEEFETDGASFVLGFSQRQQSGEGVLMDMASWLKENRINQIDLIMMNIEAYEFKLIPYMIGRGILPKVKYFMCQFHPRTYEQQDEFEVLKKQIEEIMDVHFDYGIMLMCWKAKEIPETSKTTIGVDFGKGDQGVVELVGPDIPETPADLEEKAPEKPKSRRTGGRKKKAG